MVLWGGGRCACETIITLGAPPGGRLSVWSRPGTGSRRRRQGRRPYPNRASGHDGVSRLVLRPGAVRRVGAADHGDADVENCYTAAQPLSLDALSTECAHRVENAQPDWAVFRVLTIEVDLSGSLLSSTVSR